jgi:hypothetical protein
MTKFTTQSGEYLAVGVPDGATEEIDLIAENEIAFRIKNPDEDSRPDDFISKYISLPDGHYTLIATTPLTEEQAEEIVSNNGMGCYDNYRLKKDNKYTCTTALQSFNCLLHTAGIKGRVAILKVL